MHYSKFRIYSALKNGCMACITFDPSLRVLRLAAYSGRSGWIAVLPWRSGPESIALDHCAATRFAAARFAGFLKFTNLECFYGEFSWQM